MKRGCGDDCKGNHGGLCGQCSGYIVLCPCGQPMVSSSANPYQTVKYGKDGDIIFAICFHGLVVINKEENVVQ